MTYGLFIDYGYCTGCHTCEVACKKEHHLKKGQWGIHVLQDGPVKKRTVRGSSPTFRCRQACAICAASALARDGFPCASTTARRG